ncbi:hypothetical protein IEQ34_003785 [Dendrobium chrysotoxum]|uniref:Uncharacterized protein n=1 Tax=Dendrobium chrysotoxum TaxID=161865 RepID=A0AAV7HFD2_DENCH|nr:hypothetical protein IEQ34_003785 [Dendrobium chrysotoxum]
MGGHGSVKTGMVVVGSGMMVGIAVIGAQDGWWGVNENRAGDREKLYQWIIRQHEGGSRFTLADIVGYLQNEIDDGGHDSSTSPRLHYAGQHPQATFPLTSNVQTPSGLLGSAVGFVPRSSNQLINQELCFLKCSLQPCSAESPTISPCSG